MTRSLALLALIALLPLAASGQDACIQVQSCVDAGVVTGIEACRATSPGCAATSASLAISAGQLAEGAIAQLRCMSAAATKNRSRCEACYRRAAAVIRPRRRMSAIARGLMKRAHELVELRSASVCPVLGAAQRPTPTARPTSRPTEAPSYTPTPAPTPGETPTFTPGVVPTFPAIPPF
jgi:hypothetical protein